MTHQEPIALETINARFTEDGYAFPYRALPLEEALDYRARFETLMAKDDKTREDLRTYAHLVFPIVDELVHDDRVIDAAAAVLGPDILLWGSGFFPKPPRTSDFVSWHQDLTYWGLDSTDEVTVWLALSPVTIENGCMRFVPGSHTDGIQRHTDTFAESNSLSRGQVLDIDIDEEKAVQVTLQPGELSVHHGRLFHASGPNNTDRWRLGLAMQFIAPSMRQVVARKDFAQLVRGEDRFGHFELLPRPECDYDPVCMAKRDELIESMSEAFFAKSERTPEEGRIYVN